MRICGGLVACLLLLGCGSEADRPSSAEITEPADPEATATEEADPAPQAPPEPEPEPVERVRYTLPEGRPPAPDRLRTRVVTSRAAVWEELRHPSAVAQRRVNALVRELAYDHGNVPWAPRHPDIDGGCRYSLATERVVAVLCQPMVFERGGSIVPDEGRVAAHFVIDGDEVRPFDLADALRDGTRFGDLVDRPRCVSNLQPRSRNDAVVCNRELADATGVLTPRGIDLLLGERYTVSRPWSSIREHVREEGPVAWLFEAVDRPPPPREPFDGWAVGPIVPELELATRPPDLDDELAANVRIGVRGASTAQLVVPRALGWPRAHAVAAALDVTPRRARFDATERAVRVRTTEPAVLRASAAGADLRWLPRGTYLSVLTAADEGLGTEPVHAAVAPDRVGWIEPARIAPVEGCEPPREPFERAMGEAAAERLLVARQTVRTGEREVDAAIATSRGDDDLRIRVVELGDDCALGDEPLLDVTTRGFLYDLRTTTTEPDGAGETLLIVGVVRGGDRHVLAYRLGSSTPVFRQAHDEDAEGWDETDDFGRLPRVELGRSDPDHDAYYPVRIPHLGGFEWSGRRLVRPDGD